MRFEQGELARFVVAATQSGLRYANTVVEVLFVGRFQVGEIIGGKRVPYPADYGIRFHDGVEGLVDDYQLQKIDPEEEPKSLTRSKEETA